MTLNRYKHNVRGNNHLVLDENVTLQIASGGPSGAHVNLDNTRMVLYEDETDHKLYTRPYDEFHDGRFTKLDEHPQDGKHHGES